MTYRYARGFGANESPALPASFYATAAKLLAEAQLTLERGRMAYAVDPVGVATLQSVIGLKVKSFEEVRAGALAPDKWIAGMDELIRGIDDFFKYQDASAGLTYNMKMFLIDMKKDLQDFLKKAGGGAAVGLGLFAVGAGLYVAWRLFR